MSNKTSLEPAWKRRLRQDLALLDVCLTASYEERPKSKRIEIQKAFDRIKKRVEEFEEL